MLDRVHVLININILDGLRVPVYHHYDTQAEN